MPTGLIHLPKLAPSGITVNSVGAGNSNGGFNATAISLTFTVDVQPGANRAMYSYVGVGQVAWVDNYATLTASSSIDGAFTQITRLQYGDSSGYRQAGLFLGELLNPTVGLHTITISASYFQNLNVLMGNAICFNGVGGRGPVQTQLTTGAASAQSITVPARAGGVGDLILVGQAQSANSVRSGAWPAAAPGLFYSVEANVSGDMDVMKLAYVPDTDGTAKTFSGTNTGAKHAVAGIRLTKA